MKVAICTKGNSLQSEVDDRFGRAEYFVIVDMESEVEEVERNPALALGSGAGVQSTQWLSNRGVKVLIASNVGPKAARSLEAAGIQIHRARYGTGSENLEALKRGQLKRRQDPSVGSHFGSGRGRRR